MSMFTIELRMADVTAALIAKTAAEAIKAINQECTRRGLGLDVHFDHRTREAVLVITGEAAAVRQLEAAQKALPAGSPA